MFPSIYSPLIDITVYSTKYLIILTGYNQTDGSYRLLEISRPDGTAEVELGIIQGSMRTRVEIDAHLKELSEATTVETIAIDVALVFGFIRLLDNNYIILVTKKKKCASLHGHDVYTIAETELICVTSRPKAYKPSAEESKYKAILQQTDLTKNFYFSYTYDLTDTMQNNFKASFLAQELNSCKAARDMFIWNNFALKPLHSISELPREDSHLWVVPVIHGYLKQKTLCLSTGQTIKYCLIARRSRMFAGTRYLRRGVNIDGYVANEVESEQIFTREGNKYGQADRSSSMVQLRGSIPMFWSNTSVYAAKPDIKIEDEDPDREATRAHLKHVIGRYGGGITFLNLVRQKESKPKESRLSAALMDAFCMFSEPAPAPDRREPAPLDPSYKMARFLSQLDRDTNEKHPINFCCYDFLNADHHLLFQDLEKIDEGAFPSIGFFAQPPVWRHERDEYIEFPLTGENARYAEILAGASEAATPYPDPHSSSTVRKSLDTAGIGLGFPLGLAQVGVFRTNCIDCLDRTNVGMFVYAKTVAFRQLRALGIELSGSGFSDLMTVMTQIWAEHGDTIATQYAGSGAMHRLDASSSTAKANGDGETEIKVVGGVGNAVVAARRYYSNVSTDFDRQQSFDLLLGIYEPHMHNDNIWVLEEKLQNKRTTKGRRASDALDLRASTLSAKLAEEEVKVEETAERARERLLEDKIYNAHFLKLEEDLRLSKIVVKLQTKSSKNSFYDDAHQCTLFLDRFEDRKYECDDISMDGLAWKPYTTKVLGACGVDDNTIALATPGAVEQDLYFGRKPGSTRQEILYGRYVSLENIPLYAPSSSLFDQNSGLLESLMAMGLRGGDQSSVKWGASAGLNGGPSPAPPFPPSSAPQHVLSGEMQYTDEGAQQAYGYENRGGGDGHGGTAEDDQPNNGGMSRRISSLFSFGGKRT